MNERSSDIIPKKNEGKKSSSERNDDALKYLSGSITTLPPLELGPISEAPIQPSWHQNEGYVGLNNTPVQHTRFNGIFGGNEIIGSNGITELSPVGFENSNRTIPPTPAAITQAQRQNPPSVPITAAAPSGTPKPTVTVKNIPQATSPEKKENSTSTPPNGSEIPEQLQQMFINQGGSAMRWVPENRIWRSTREMENEEQAIQKAEEWNKIAPDGKHGNAAQAAGYRYVAEGKRVFLRKK